MSGSCAPQQSRPRDFRHGSITKPEAASPKVPFSLAESRRVVDLGELMDAIDCTKRPWGGLCQSSRSLKLHAELSSIKKRKKARTGHNEFFFLSLAA
jgi:hypothetical protein